MQWTCVSWVLVSTAVIVSSVSDGSRHKRNLSFLTRLFSNGMGRSQEKCTKTHRKPLKAYDFFIIPGRQNLGVEIVPEISRSKGIKTGKYNDDNFFINSIRQFLASDTFQETSEAFGGVITTLVSGDSTTEIKNKQNARKPHYASGHKLTVDNKFTRTMIPEKQVEIEKNAYTPVALPPVVSFMSPIISMPRKYSYEQIRGKEVQTFSLDKNSDVIVRQTSSRLPRPAYVEDRIKDVILSVPSFAHTIYPSNVYARHETTSKPNVVFGQEGEMVDMKMLPTNDIFTNMYAGKPIVVLDNTSKVMDASVLIYDNEVNKTEERNIKEKTRGDIPESSYIL